MMVNIVEFFAAIFIRKYYEHQGGVLLLFCSFIYFLISLGIEGLLYPRRVLRKHVKLSVNFFTIAAPCRDWGGSF